MNRRASGHDGELLVKADEVDNRAVSFVPLGATAWTPALLAGGLIGNGEGGGEKILYWTTHGRVITRRALKQKGPRTRPEEKAPMKHLRMAVTCLVVSVTPALAAPRQIEDFCFAQAAQVRPALMGRGGREAFIANCIANHPPRSDFEPQS